LSVASSLCLKRYKTNDLSVDMISPPLGDFRHTMHVGRGGDVFGDTSFLSNYGGIREPGSPDSNSGPRPRGGSRDLSSPPPDISPIIKNAISLPQLNMDSPNGCLQRVLFPSSVSSTDDSFCTYEPLNFKTEVRNGPGLRQNFFETFEEITID
uniref:CDC42 effector protein (Rho GTPase binding) 1b n=1 Tax=Lates calcarifer TaxID=8187 RepID=A0A4W6DKU1_LATCA